MIAGLLNILAVYDACCGPVVVAAKDEEADEPQKDVGEDEVEDKS